MALDTPYRESEDDGSGYSADRLQRRLSPPLSRIATVPGLVWQIFWIWPTIQFARLAAVACMTFAIAAWSMGRDPAAYAYPWNFAAMSLVPLFGLFYLHFFESLRTPSFTVASGRALAVLPAPHNRLRIAAWLSDLLVPSFALLTVTLPILFLMPTHAAFKVWFALALVSLLAAMNGLYASMLLGQLYFVRTAPQSLLEKTYLRIDALLGLASFVSLLTIMFALREPWPVPVAAGVGLTTLLWSYFRTPLLASGKGGGDAGSRGGGLIFANRWREVLRPYAQAFGFSFGGIIVIHLSILFMQMRMDKELKMDGVMLPMLAMMAGAFGGMLGMRVRALRQLPLSTSQITLGLSLYGALAAVPVAGYALYVLTEQLNGVLLLLAAAGFGLITMAFMISSLWSISYRIASTVAHMVVMMAALVFGTFALMDSEDAKAGELAQGAMAVFAIGVLSLALALWSVQKKFWWNSKVYRVAYQNPQQQQGANLGESGEIVILVVYAVVGAASLLYGVYALFGF